MEIENGLFLTLPARAMICGKKHGMTTKALNLCTVKTTQSFQPCCLSTTYQATRYTSYKIIAPTSKIRVQFLRRVNWKRQEQLIAHHCPCPRHCVRSNKWCEGKLFACCVEYLLRSSLDQFQLIQCLCHVKGITCGYDDVYVFLWCLSHLAEFLQKRYDS